MEICATHDMGIPERNSSLPEFFLDEGSVGVKLLGDIRRPVAENLPSPREKNGKERKRNQPCEQEGRVWRPAFWEEGKNMIHKALAHREDV